MARNTVNDMTMNFGKLDKFEGHDFRQWQKKMHFLLTTLKVVYVLTTPMPELLKDAIVEAIRIRAKKENDDYICRGHIMNGMSDSLFDVYTNVESAKELWDSLESKYMAEDFSRKKFLDFKHTLKHGKDDLSLVQLGSHLRIKESLRAQDSDKGKGKEVGGPSVNMTEEGDIRTNERRICTYMDDDHFAPVHGKGSVALEFSFGKTITLFNVLYVPKLRKNLLFGPMLNKCGYKQVYESDKYILLKSGMFEGFGYYNNGIIHETTTLYTPQQNGVAERKNRALKEMVNFMLSYSGLSEGFWGEAMLTARYLLNRIPNKRSKTTPYELCDCIFVGYAEHSKAYKFYIIEPNDSVSINSIVESRDAIFDENHFSSIPRPKNIKPNSDESQMDDLSDDVPNEIHEPRKVGLQYSCCYSIEEDLRTSNEAMQSQDSAFWKEAIDDEIGSIMENNTRVLSDLPPGCKPLGFRQKEGNDYFDTYVQVARITTIRLPLALAAIHNLVIHQMDVDKTKKFLSSRFSMKDMGETGVILGIKIKLKNKGIFITQSHYIEKILKKFNREDCSPVVKYHVFSVTKDRW
nr:zinc finger, CCHC-type [Tanacetum cinerariifolium]